MAGRPSAECIINAVGCRVIFIISKSDSTIIAPLPGHLFTNAAPPPSSRHRRHHLSYNDCLEYKRGNYRSLFTVSGSQINKKKQLFTMIRTHKQYLQVSVAIGLGLVFVRLLRFSGLRLVS